MNIRFFKLNDKQEINSWCKERQLPEMNEDLISNLGLAVEDSGKLMCVIWLYPVQISKICYIDGLISNPQIDSEKRKNALDMLFNSLHEIIKNMGYKYIKLVTNNESLKSRFEKYGYIKDDEYIQFIGVL